MPDSSITKQALASALKDLMQEMPFDKIRVSHICDKCNMNRQSFYYHFQDKYELMNWIFDMEFIGLIGQDEANQSIEEMTALLRILYDNRCFYRNALSVQGQNSLIEHIREIAMPLLEHDLQTILKNCFPSKMGFGNQYLSWSQLLNAGEPIIRFLLLELQTSNE